MWPNARIGVMGGEQAGNVLVTVKLKRLQEQGVRMTEEEKEKLMKPILEKYEEEANPYFSTARLWDDGILDPLETREALALGISMSLNAPIPDYKVGIFRM
jgi:acetyl-CoA carboxylase carboxyltransferase component